MTTSKFKQFEIDNQEQVKAGVDDYFMVTCMDKDEEGYTTADILYNDGYGNTEMTYDVNDLHEWYVGYRWG